MTKAWIEMLHRYFAMAVGFLIVVLMVMAWQRWRRDRSRSPWLATVIFFAVCLQGAFGAWTVTMKLQPLIVTVHLLGGLTLLALLVWLALREGGVASFPRKREPSVSRDVAGFPLSRERRVKGLAVFALALLYAQIALGGWVSTNYAVLACPDFPLCQGQWLPPMNFAQGFTLWRDLGETASGEPIVFAALVAIHWTHRHFAYLVFAVLGLLAWRLWRVPGCERLARALVALLLAQLATGVSNVVFAWPLLAAVLHTGGAALLVGVLVAINFRLARLW
jgi:cytochrome c oxidase assembly protein subunit 15